MENMSFFDLFGAEGAEYKPVVEKKPEKKEEKKKGVKTITYDLPLKVITGIFPEFPVKAEDIGKENITSEELHELIYNKFEQFPKELTQLTVKGMLCKVQQKHYASYLTDKKKLIDEGWRITLNGFSLPLDGGIEIDLESVKVIWETQYPCFKGIKYKLLYDDKTKVIVPFIESDKLSDKVELPCTVFLFGQEEVVVGGEDPDMPAAPAPEEKISEEKAEVEADDSDELSDSDDEDEDEDEDSSDEEEEDDEDESAEASDEEEEKPVEKKTEKKGKKYLINDLRKYLSKVHDGLEFAVVKCKDGKYMAYPSSAYVNSDPAPRKEPTFPTVDTQIGLIFTKIKLSPELFGGKKAVTEKEICKFLAKDYEEFADASRVSIIYDKERKLIKPMIAAARKGAVPTVYSMEEVNELLGKGGYQLFNYSEDPKHLWRYEKTPIGTFKMLWGGTSHNPSNTFTFALPKVPEKVWRKMIYLFKRYARFNLEVCCLLLYEEGIGYSIQIPEQEVGPGMVKYDPSALMNYCVDRENAYIVADLHSHNTMPAFFSSIDDADEKRAGLFGVMGSWDERDKSYDFLLRAGTQGLYTALDPADIFEGWQNRYNYVSCVPYAFTDEEASKIHSNLKWRII